MATMLPIHWQGLGRAARIGSAVVVGLLATLLIPEVSSADVTGGVTLSPTSIPRYETFAVEATFEVTSATPLPLEVRLDETWTYGGTMSPSAITTTGPISCTTATGLDPSHKHYVASIRCPWTQPAEVGQTASIAFTLTDLRLPRDYILFGSILFESSYVDTTNESHPVGQGVLNVGTPTTTSTRPAATTPPPTTVAIAPVTTVTTSSNVESGTAEMPATGESTAAIALAAGIALTAGVAMLFAVRRRRPLNPD